MKDYIKELNIIDFLGITVPGTLLVLLITGDNTALLLWHDYFGSDATVWVRGTFLLIAGYLAGMLLHEIGDCLEKGTWCFHPLDPKAYAANAVGAQKIEDAMVRANLLAEDRPVHAFTYVIPPVVKGILGSIATISLLILSTVGFCPAMNSACYVVNSSNNPAIDAKIYFTVCALIAAGITILFVLACLLWNRYAHVSWDRWMEKIALKRIQHIANNKKIYCSNFSSAYTLINDFFSAGELDSFSQDRNAKRECILDFLKTQARNGSKFSKDWKRIHKIFTRYFKPRYTSADKQKHSGKKGRWETIHNICVCNPLIQTYVTVHGVHSKQSMFDSFRHVMRNLIICIAIVNTYSIWHPVEVYQDIARYFVFRANIHQDFLWLCVCFTLTVFMMFIRYNHFVFLRYKYGYENFIEISQKTAGKQTKCVQEPENQSP